MTCNTADGIDHGAGHLEDCIDAVVERYEDGFVHCPILWNDGSCEDCYRNFERREQG